MRWWAEVFHFCMMSEFISIVFSALRTFAISGSVKLSTVIVILSLMPIATNIVSKLYILSLLTMLKL